MADEKGALTSYLESKKDENIQRTLAASPAVSAQSARQVEIVPHRQPLSVGELANIVAPQGSAASAQKLYAPAMIPAEQYSGDDAGTPYGATRADALSPAKQNTNAAVITDQPQIRYLGGGTPRGARIRAEYPGEEDTFYLKQKFEPVKPYPLPLSNGQTTETTTTNLNKAMWLYMAASEPASDIDWWGYYKMPDIRKEGPVHAFVRGAVNAIPNLSVRAAGFVSTVYADGAEALGRIIDNQALVDYGNSLRNIVYKTTDELMQDVTWQYGPEGVGDRDANKFWYIGGNAAAYIPLGFMNQMRFLPFLELAEAADSAMYVRQTMEEKGRSFWGSIGGATGAFGAVYAIGITPKVVETIAKSTMRPAQGLVKLAKENPEQLRRLVRNQRLLVAAVEGVSEPGQDVVTNAIAGESPEWEDALATLFWSALISYGSLAATPNNTPERIKERVQAIQNFAAQNQEFLDAIVAASNGAISRENIDMILEKLADPEESGALLNYVKEAVVANFDKLSDEDKQRLNDYIKNLDPESDLDKEFAALDTRINKLLDDSAAADIAAGGTPLTDQQRALARLMLRGVAANQLARMGVLPSEMILPTSISGSFNRANTPNGRKRNTYSRQAEGMTNTETGDIIVNNELAQSGMPVGTVAATGSTSQNMNVSAAVKTEYANAGVSSPQTTGFAGLSHEFWHWIESATGLPQIGEFMVGMQQLAETLVPNITSGKSGVELSEAYAYAMGYAGDKLKSVLGFTGPVSDYIDFMNTTLNAQDIAQGTIDALQAYMDSFRGVLKANREIVDDIIDGFGTTKLKGAVNHFIETGDKGALTLDDIRGLNAALASAADATTNDNLSKIFDNPQKATSFMQRYADEYDRLLAQDRGNGATNLKETIAAADKVAGVSPAITPATAKQNSVLSKADELITQEEPDEIKEIDRKLYGLDMARYEVEYADASNYLSYSSEIRALMKQKRKLQGYSDEQAEEADKIQKQIDEKEAQYREKTMSLVSEKEDVDPKLEQKNEKKRETLRKEHDKEIESLQKQLNEVLASKQEETASAEESTQKYTPTKSDLVEDAIERVLENAANAGHDELLVDVFEGWPEELKEEYKEFTGGKMDSSNVTLQEFLDKVSSEERRQEETKSEAKPTETATEEEPRRMRNDGTPYDVDELVRGNFDDAPDLVTGYLENAVKWLKEDNLTRGDLEGRSVRVSRVGTTPVLTLNPSLGTSRADHRAAYVILAKNKLKQMDKQGKLTPELKQRTKDTEMFAVVSNTKAALDAPLELLAARVANNEAKPDEVALYKSIREFNNKLDSIYVEFGPYTPLSQAYQALSATNELLADLQELSRGSDKNVKALISGQASNEGWIETAFGNRVVSREKRVRPYKRKDGTVVMTADFGTPRSLIEVISDYHDRLVRQIENEESDIDPIVQPDIKPSKKEAQMIGIATSAKTSPLQKYRARAYLGAIGQNAADEVGKYFRPDYNEEYSERNVAVDTLSAAEAFADNREATEEERAGAAELVRQQQAMSPYLNAINGYLKRDIIHTPTPLEELGISMEQAEEEIRAAGLEPYNFMQEDGTVAEVAKQLLTNEYIGRRLNSENPEISLKTRRTMLARLLQEVKPIGNSKNRAEQLQVLHAISSAKAAVDQLFSAYIDREDSYNNNPTMSPQAFESAHEFVKSDRFPRVLEEHLARGYTEEIAAQELGIADEVMFPYGNNMFRGVVAFKFKTPAGARGLVIYEDVDIDAWRAKDLATVVKPPRQLVVSEANLNDIGVMRKPLENSDPSRFTQLSKLFDDVCALHENFTNYRRVAEAAIADADDESLLRSIVMPDSVVESDEDVEASEYDADDEANLYTEMYAVASDSPLVDPGAFVLMDGNMTAADWSLYDKTQEGYIQAVEEGTVTPEQHQYMWEMLHERQENKSESLKPRFIRFGAERRGIVKELREALQGRKINKLLLMGAWGTSLDRKGRSIFGDAFSKRFNTVMASSRAQSISESKRHALDQAVTNEVFNGSRVEYERWLRQKSLDTFDTTLYNGLQVKITRGEIITLAMAKKAVESNLFDANEYTNEYERMTKTYSNVDELLGHLSEQDMKFVDVGLNAIANARGADAEGSLVPTYWVPTVLATDYVANGWDARPSKTPDNSFSVIGSQEALAAPDAFDSIMSLIGNSAMKESHLMDELQMLHDVLLFKDVDLSQFKSLNADEVALYDELVKESALLRQDLQNAIGATMSKWFVENIKTDLKYNPALKEFAANPVLGGFQRLTRTVASSLLMVSPKQGLVNLGNYHLFLGLSNSGQAKFYTADWMNAIAHLRDAWKLALENPEFKRRLEQSGLSEQMRRVADMNEDSFLTDLQDALYKNGKTGISNALGSINTFSKIATKYGLATNVIPDFLGIALGNYAVYNDVLTRNNGNVARTQEEIANFILNRVSSSNYETRSAATKTLQKMGLEALVLFQNDQLQKIGTACEAAIDLMNSSDPAVRKRAWKDIEAVAYSTLRYVAIQAGWLAAIIQVLSGADLSDEEKEYLYEATLREVLAQIGGTTQLGSVITPVLNGMFGGRDMGVTLAPYGSLQRMSTAARKGDIKRVLAEIGALTGIAPIAPGSVRILDALWKMASEDDREFMVGLLMLGGRSPATSEKMLGLIRSQKTGKLRPKKSNKKKDDKD